MTDEALAWAVAKLDTFGRTVVATEQVKDRPWSRVVRLRTDAGVCWLKVNRGGTTYEPALLTFLAAISPETVTAPLATIGGWSLLADGGPTLREVRGDARPSLDAMIEFVRAAAVLQRRTAAHIDELIALGVPDLRPSRLPAAFDALLGERGWLRIGEEDGLSAETYDRLVAFRSHVEDASARLADGPVAPTLQHDDLHDNNVFAGLTYRIFDWGDASVAHPFATLLVTLSSLASQLDTTTDHPVLIAVRDAYLACWSDLAPPEELVEEAHLAISLAPIGRALSWQRALADASPEQRAQWQGAIPGWLEELLS
jgi:Phosphotransferase enzyme family